MLSSLVGLGRNTVTGMLCASGRQFSDWSADYRFFSKDRWDAAKAWSAVRRRSLEELSPHAPVVYMVDDTLMRKTGSRIPGAAWRRDPLGPKFQTNLAWAQRFLQISVALPSADSPSGARAIPVDFVHAPTPPKPGRKAGEEERRAYRAAQRKQRLGQIAVERLHALRSDLDRDGAGNRQLWCAGDGGYTNETVLKQLPERTVFIGRIRGDARLHALPDEQPTRGRKRAYGHKVPTPAELIGDHSVPYQTVKAQVGGLVHDFKIKTIGPVRWRTSGQQHDLRLVVVAPLSYRLRKGARLLYRKPAFLICTDPNLPPEQILQTYVWRFGVEVNFRDEKQIIGVGQAQVRDDLSVERIPAFLVVAYSMLLLAARRAYANGGFIQTLPPPKWMARRNPCQATTSALQQKLREELWGKALGIHFSGFANHPHSHAKPLKSIPNLSSCVLYMRN